jgi:hypothetical protein
MKFNEQATVENYIIKKIKNKTHETRNNKIFNQKF